MKDKIKKLKNFIPRELGYITVDAGIVWIGDPCYILHNEDGVPKSLGKNWDEFCDILGDDNLKVFKKGICTSTLYGDGAYSVIGFFENEEDTRPHGVFIDFGGIFADDEEEEEA